ncbi:hypothetical protein HOG21_04495 [bacterium]|nr:hypothetical protein [bacterium]
MSVNSLSNIEFKFSISSKPLVLIFFERTKAVGKTLLSKSENKSFSFSLIIHL